MSSWFRAILGAAGRDTGGGGGLITGLGSLSSGSGSFEMGWEFQVGASDLTLTALRCYIPDTRSQTVRLWRVSDSSEVTSVSVSAIADTWSEASVTETTLSAGANYVVTIEISSQSRYSGNSGFSFSSDISYVTGRYNLTPGNYPTTTVANAVYGIADCVVA